jgi:hypothetical protein
MLPWIGVALLSVSWLLGLDYYHAANWPAWGAVLIAGTVLLASARGRLPGSWESAVALALAVPAVIVAPWPYRAGPVLIVAGLGLNLVVLGAVAAGQRTFGHERRPRGRFEAGLAIVLLSRCVQRISTAGVIAGCTLLAQCLGLSAYEAMTARSHELFAPLPQAISGVMNLLGIRGAAYESTVAVFSMRKTHMFGATWELLLDPATWCFVVGGTAFLAWSIWANVPPGRRMGRLATSLAAMLALIAVWLPFRAATLVAVYLDDVLRVDYEGSLNSMRLMWNPWLHLLLLGVPVLLAWRFAAASSAEDRPGPVPTAKRRQSSGAATLQRLTDALRPMASILRPLAAILVATATASFTAALFWDPVGERKQGRIVVEEFHPDPSKIWEPVSRPFDTTWYGNASGYNYYCIFDYLRHCYPSVTRWDKPLGDDALADCDVLVLKVPTRPYVEGEIGAVKRFVARGGGLLLLGEHTDVFHTGENLNAVADLFGFRFNYDCLFGIDSVFDQQLEPPLVPHPIMQHVPSMDFAISCSIDPGSSSGRAVIQSTGLKNLTADYHVDNYYPQPQDSAEMRYGAFVQLWSVRYGDGRVLAFTDSTIFSNFCTFEPGKKEILLGMIEWLNHGDTLGDPRPWLLAAGFVLLATGLACAWGWDGGWLVLLGSGLLSWAVIVVVLPAVHRAAMSLPQPDSEKPLVEVVMDRTVCKSPLPKDGFIAGKDDEFGIFERWILRVGYFTSRRSGTDVFAGDLAVFPYPTGQPSGPFREALIDYVASGGRVLVLDSPENAEESTANDLLEPFGLSIGRTDLGRGELKTSYGAAPVPVVRALAVEGGKPLATVGGRPVGAVADYGRGQVVALGFGSRFTDRQMGVTGDVEPDEALKQVFDVEYLLLRAIIGGTLPAQAPAVK